MGILDSLSGAGGYDDWNEDIQKGMDARNQYHQQAVNRLQPYASYGTKALPALWGAYGQMADPNEFINNFMQHYQQSPWAKHQIAAGDQGITAADAASGMLGSNDEKEGLAQFNQNIAEQDQQNYLNNLFGVWNQYLGGLTGFAGRGQQAATQQGSWDEATGGDIANMYNQMGKNEADKAASKSHTWGNIAGMAADALTSWL